MKFSFEESNIEYSYIIGIETNQHVRLEFFMQHGDCEEILVDGCDYKPSSETINGLWVGIGDKFYTLYEVMREAERAFPSLFGEYLTEKREEYYNDKYLSSLRLTGRI